MSLGRSSPVYCHCPMVISVGVRVGTSEIAMTLSVVSSPGQKRLSSGATKRGGGGSRVAGALAGMLLAGWGGDCRRALVDGLGLHRMKWSTLVLGPVGR